LSSMTNTVVFPLSKSFTLHVHKPSVVPILSFQSARTQRDSPGPARNVASVHFGESITRTDIVIRICPPRQWHQREILTLYSNPLTVPWISICTVMLEAAYNTVQLACNNYKHTSVRVSRLFRRIELHPASDGMALRILSVRATTRPLVRSRDIPMWL